VKEPRAGGREGTEGGCSKGGEPSPRLEWMSGRTMSSTGGRMVPWSHGPMVPWEAEERAEERSSAGDSMEI